MYNRFKDLGVPVIITRDTDKTLSRAERLNTMRSLGTDPNVIILSNHINAGGGEGAEVVYPLRTSSTLPRMILEAIGEEGQIMRKYYQRRLPENPSKDYYYIMRETPNTTSLLIEYGFIDNPNDQRKLKNNILDYAEAVVKAVSNYIGVPYTLPNNNENKGNDLENIYTVKRGDTLYSIARMFNTTVDQIKALNNLTSNTLQIGQELIVNEEVYIPPVEDNGQIYIVQRGDTLYGIAGRYNTTVKDILDLNNLGTTILTPGQQLLIPGVTNEEPQVIPSTYTVLPNDTLYSISRKFNTTVEELKYLNNLTSNTLSIGEILKIPSNTLNTTYKVQRGDSLWKIANMFNTSVATIKEVNNLTSDILQIGQELIIP